MRRPSLVLCASSLLAAILAPASVGGEELDAELQDLTWVGFQQFEEASRVFVRTTEKARYRVDTSREDMVVLVIENTRVPVFNNTRPLDTRYFDSPVRSVEARPIEGPSQSVSVEIRLRRRVPYKVSQADTVLAIDFTR